MEQPPIASEYAQIVEKLHRKFVDGSDLMFLFNTIQSGEPVWSPRYFSTALPTAEGEFAYYDFYQHGLQQGTIGVFNDNSGQSVIAHSFLTNKLLGNAEEPLTIGRAIEIVESHTKKHWIRRNLGRVIRRQGFQFE